MKKLGFIEVILYSIMIVIIFLFIAFNYSSKTILGGLLLVYNFYVMYKNRKNKKILFLFLAIFYFNYSFCITKYIGPESDLLSTVYGQIRNEKTYIVGIIQQIIFLFIIDLFISKYSDKIKENKYENTTIEFKYRKVLIYIMNSFLIFTLLYHIANKITVNSSWFEYSIYIFILSLYFSKQDKKLKIFTELILVAFSIYSLKNGDRIAVLQFLITDFLINYINKLSIKQIILIMMGGIFAFTFLGLYGDILDFGRDFEKLNVEYTIAKIKERRFALDTSVSAYFSGLSIIDLKDIFENTDRIMNGIEYFTRYTLLGTISAYKDPSVIVRDYQVNYGGAFLTTYFYYWFGKIGVILISCYVGYLLKKTMTSKTLYGYLLNIFIIATVPRWYMYIPTLLFRGILIFNIIYFIVYMIFIKKRKADFMI